MNDYGEFAVFHEDVFVKYYKPHVPRRMPRAEVYGDFELQPSKRVFEMLKKMDRRYVWTIIESDVESRRVYYSPGFRMVNRVGYVVTKRPHNDASIEFCAYWRRTLSERGLTSEVMRLHAYLKRDALREHVPTSAASN